MTFLQHNIPFVKGTYNVCNLKYYMMYKACRQNQIGPVPILVAYLFQFDQRRKYT